MRCQPIDADLLAALWTTERRSDELCEILGCTRGHLYHRAKRLGLPPRPAHLEAMTGPASEKDDPSELEIAQRAALIRKTWTEEEREKRFVGRQRGRVEIVNYIFDPESYSFRY